MYSFFCVLAVSEPHNITAECYKRQRICEREKQKSIFFDKSLRELHIFIWPVYVFMLKIRSWCHTFFSCFQTRFGAQASFGRSARRFTATWIRIVIHAIVLFLRHDLLFRIRFIFHYAKYGQCRPIRCTCIDYYFVCAGFIWWHINDVNGALNKYVSCVIDNNVRITNALI